MDLRKLILPLSVAIVGTFLLAWDGLLTQAFTDYELEAEPAFNALRAGDLGRFFQVSPNYGGSLIMRAPFVYMSEALGGGSLAAFRAAALPCLVAGIAFAVFLFAQTSGRGKWLVLALATCNPITLRALEIGHPEELLGAVLCIGAVLCALSDRPWWAGVLLGLALANKAWAIVAIGPVLVALSHGRIKVIATSGAIAFAFAAPLLLHGSDAIATTTSAFASRIFQPWQIWWFLGDHGAPVYGTYGIKEGYRTGPDWVVHVGRVLIATIGIPLSLLFWRLKRDRGDALGLLVLLLALRCVLDSWDAVYYSLPMLMALLTWEVHRGRRAPIATLVVTILTWFSFELAPDFLSADLQAFVYLLWMVPLVALLTARVFVPQHFAALALAARSRTNERMPTLTRTVSA